MSRIMEMLQAVETDYHPLVSILKISRDDNADLRLQLDCHRSIAKFVESERKSVDVRSGDGSELVSLNINVS